MQSFFLQFCSKEFVGFLCECIVSLLKGKLRSIKKHHKTKFQSKVRLLKRITWKQRTDVLASKKGLQLIKIFTPPVNNHLCWIGTVCLRSCFRVKQQQMFEYSDSYKAGACKVSSSTKSHVPNWFTQKRNKQKAVCQSRLSGPRYFVLSSYQALNFSDFIIGWCGNWSFTVRLCSTTSS